ncbi:MAG: hypothetical protein OXE99_00670, partial [Cellvibrionales bacterium]|nr:hypothetical protein [Cellvibrionales bacterium]
SAISLNLDDSLKGAEVIDAQVLISYQLDQESSVGFIEADGRCEKIEQIPAVTFNSPSEGAAVFAGFDILAFAATDGLDSAMSQLFTESLNKLWLNDYALVAGESLHLSIELKSQSKNEGRIILGLPEGFIMQSPTAFSYDQDWSMAFDIQEGQILSESVIINTPPMAGNYPIQISVERLVDGEYQFQTQTLIDVNLIAITNTLADAITALDELKTQHPRNADLQFASWYLGQVSADDVTDALAIIELALGSLKSSGVDTQAIQVLLAREVIKLNQQ